jgi:hypothetical protein
MRNEKMQRFRLLLDTCEYADQFKFFWHRAASSVDVLVALVSRKRAKVRTLKSKS